VTAITPRRAAPSTTTLQTRVPEPVCSSIWLAVVKEVPPVEPSMSIGFASADPTIGTRRRCSQSVMYTDRALIEPAHPGGDERDDLVRRGTTRFVQ